MDWLRTHAEAAIASLLLLLAVPLHRLVGREVEALHADCALRRQQLARFVARVHTSDLRPGEPWHDVDRLFFGHRVLVASTGGLPHIVLQPTAR